MNNDDQELVKRNIAFYELTTSNPEYRKSAEYDEAYNFVMDLDDLVRSDPDRAWSLILGLIDQAPTQLILAIVAAGPLEDLLVLHGTAVIERVEIQARQTPKFRKCLRAVWGENRMEEDIFLRVDKACADEPIW